MKSSEETTKISLNRYFKLALLTTAVSLFIPGQTLASEGSPFENLPPEMKAKILEKTGEPQKYGEVSQNFNEAMQYALKTHTAHIKASQLTKDNVEALKQVGNLNLIVDNADDATMVLIGQLTNLQSLGLGASKVTDAGLSHIEGLINLKELRLNDTKITDGGLVHLRNLTNLTLLTLSSTPVTDAGLTHLSGLKKLKKLGLGNTNITGQGFANLNGINFEYIVLVNAKINNDGLAGLSKLSVIALDLSGTNITDEGLPHLYGLKSLQFLGLTQTKVTKDGVATLKLHLPDTQIFENS